MNLQFSTGIYGLLAYLCSYMLKEEEKRGKIMRKLVKEALGLNVRKKLRKLGNIFLKKHDVSTDEAIKQHFSLSMRLSNIGCDFIFTGLFGKQEVFQKIHPEDTNIFAN